MGLSSASAAVSCRQPDIRMADLAMLADRVLDFGMQNSAETDVNEEAKYEGRRVIQLLVARRPVYFRFRAVLHYGSSSIRPPLPPAVRILFCRLSRIVSRGIVDGEVLILPTGNFAAKGVAMHCCRVPDFDVYSPRPPQLGRHSSICNIHA